MRYDVCIIGGGAAGLAAAVSVDGAKSLCIIEKNKIPGRKVLATGGGRCNLTNESCGEKQLTMDFFASLGLRLCKDSEGRYYPYSERASDVVKILTDGISDSAEFFYGCHAMQVVKAGRTFKVTCKGKREFTIEASNVILAVGGKAAPQYGSTGDGYSMAAKLGHTFGKLYPILTGINCDNRVSGRDFDFKAVKGIRAKAKVCLMKDGAPVEGACERGEVQFTDYGLSGICIFNLTPLIRTEEGESFDNAMARYEVSVDLAPDFTDDEVQGKGSSFGIITENLANALGDLDIKELVFQIKGARGWKEAQCTGGGINLDEINMETMESKIVPGLYFVGEILDIQGPCGGFNLQNAWETGIKAGRAVNEI